MKHVDTRKYGKGMKLYRNHDHGVDEDEVLRYRLRNPSALWLRTKPKLSTVRPYTNRLTMRVEGGGVHRMSATPTEY